MKRKVNPYDIARLGPELAQIKAQSNPKVWKAMVREAHKRGFSVAGWLSGAPDALKERTRRSLRAEAERIVGDAYKPAEKRLGAEASRQQWIEQRRLADHQAYEQWLADQRTKLDAQARAADESLASQQREIQQATESGYKDAEAKMKAEAANQVGRVGKVEDSKALSLSDEAARANAKVAAARQFTQDLRGSASKYTQGINQSQLALGAAMAAKIRGEGAAAQKDIADKVAELAASKAGAFVDRFDKLTELEVDKASANRDFAAAAEKLKLDSYKARQDAYQFGQTLKLKKEQINLDRWIAQNKKKAEDLKLKLGYDKIAAEQGKAAADRALKAEIEKGRSHQRQLDREQRERASRRKEGRATEADKRAAREQYQIVETIAGEIRRLHRKKGRRWAAANLRNRLRKDGYSDVQIDVANDMVRNNGTLSKRGRVKAGRLGIYTEWL